MFKILFLVIFLQTVIPINVTSGETITNTHNKFIRSANKNSKDLDSKNWGGSWFPNKPDGSTLGDLAINDVTAGSSSSSEDYTWSGKWFPHKHYKTLDPIEEDKNPAIINKPQKESGDNWQGKWFPHNPNESPDEASTNLETAKLQNNSNKISNNNQTNNDSATTVKDYHNIPMGVLNINCDDGNYNLAIDFDPKNVSHSLVYMCLENKINFRYNHAIQPLQINYTIPKAYVALHKCMDTKIEYDDRLPTYGTHRPLWLKYGEYIYAPPQRWIHNLEHGAVVMLYHPCAGFSQVEKLKMIVKNCLYRHVITSSNLLLPERPLALIVWGISLEMSVVDINTVLNFIKNNALHGPEHTSRNGQYGYLLTNPAKIISNVNDTTICPNN